MEPREPITAAWCDSCESIVIALDKKHVGNPCPECRRKQQEAEEPNERSE